MQGQRLRILLSIHHPLDRDSGAAGVVMRIAEEYGRLGHDATVASHDDMPAKVPRFLRELLFPFFLATMIARLKPDVVDASSGDGWFAFSGPSARTRLRVTHSHGLEHLSSERELADDHPRGRSMPLGKRLWRHGMRLKLVARSFTRADMCLVLNDAEAIRLCAMGVAPLAIRRIRLGTDHAGISVADTERDAAAVVQIGAYSRRKGTAVTAEAMAHVMALVPTASITFIGTGVPRNTVLLDYLPRFHDRVHVIERYDNVDLPSLLAGCSICVMPSLFEGYGIAKLEAMACGLAVIVSDDAGAQADVIDRENGLVVARDDAHELRDAILHLIASPAYAADLGRSGTSTAMRFSWHEVAAERIFHYRQYLEGPT